MQKQLSTFEPAGPSLGVIESRDRAGFDGREVAVEDHVSFAGPCRVILAPSETELSFMQAALGGRVAEVHPLASQVVSGNDDPVLVVRRLLPAFEDSNLDRLERSRDLVFLLSLDDASSSSFRLQVWTDMRRGAAERYFRTWAIAYLISDEFVKLRWPRRSDEVGELALDLGPERDLSLPSFWLFGIWLTI